MAQTFPVEIKEVIKPENLPIVKGKHSRQPIRGEPAIRGAKPMDIP